MYTLTYSILTDLAKANKNMYIFIGLSVILFPDQREAAFSVNRFWYGLGYAIVLSTAFFLSVKAQIWLIVAELIVSALTYSIVTLKTSDKSQLLPCCPEKSSTSSENSENA